MLPDVGDAITRSVQQMDWLLEKYGANAVLEAQTAADNGASYEEQYAILTTLAK